MSKLSPVFLGLASVALAACGPPESSAKPAPARRPNILLVSIDTLRADHLGCYGAERPTSPRLDRFAQSAVRFEHAYAPTPWTLPSHAALLTGVDPYELGLRDATGVLPREVPTLAERLQGAGYQTAAVVDSRPGGYVGVARGFGRGFDAYTQHPAAGRPLRDDVAVTLERAEQWLGARDPARPFFLFLHTKSVHAVPGSAPCHDHRCFPYDKPDPYRFRFVTDAEATATWKSPDRGAGQAYLWALNRDLLAGKPAAVPPAEIAQLTALYDGGVAYVDEHLGQFLERAEASGLLADTVVVVTSDHGEAFGEHGLFMHQQVYEELLHVPLLVRLPGRWPGGRQGRVEPRPVALEDVAATLAELAGIPIEVMTGWPLPLTGGSDGAGSKPRLSYYLFAPGAGYRAFAVRRGDLKLVAQSPRPETELAFELYDLARDPKERSPLPASDPRLPQMRALLERLLARPPLGAPAALPGSEAIEALPYIE